VNEHRFVIYHLYISTIMYTLTLYYAFKKAAIEPGAVLHAKITEKS